MWQNRFLEKAKYLEVKSQVWKTRIPWSLRIIFHIFFKLPWIYILTIKRRLNPLNLGFWSINFNFCFNIYLTVKSLNSCNHFLIKCLVQILEITDCTFNPLNTTALILCLLKSSQYQRLSVFRGYRNKSVKWNWLRLMISYSDIIYINESVKKHCLLFNGYFCGL